MKMKRFLIVGAALSMLGIVGCTSLCRCECGKTSEIKAVYTASPIVLDGALTEEAWQKAPAYVPVFSRQSFKNSKAKCREGEDPGTFRLLWNQKYLYIGIVFKDKDIVADGLEDQMVHCRMGDLAEIFLKPVNNTYYWELYVTPLNKKTAFFYPGRGRHGLPSCLPKEIPLKKMATAVKCKGTLNNSFDTDGCWSAEVAVPIDEINARGIRLAPGVPWKILLARYNYTRYGLGKELTAFPALEQTNFHLIEEYGNLVLVK